VSSDRVRIAPAVADAVENDRPVVALESTIISHGMPYPENVETALRVEEAVRTAGAVPATIAVIGGKPTAGLTRDEIERIGKAGGAVRKVSRRDLPFAMAFAEDGATTVAATMIVAAAAGIRVFATGGIGGVHRGAQDTFDISADLEELARTDVAVVCAGAKSILDLGLTLEYLETRGVPVIGYRTDELPAFYTRSSGHKLEYRLDSPADIARVLWEKWDGDPRAVRDAAVDPVARRVPRGGGMRMALDLHGGVIVANPVPDAFSMQPETIQRAIEQALAEAGRQNVRGKETTPFLLARIKELTSGESLVSNRELVLSNAALAADIAVRYAELRRRRADSTISVER
jgi:pseudouridylate synthase